MSANRAEGLSARRVEVFHALRSRRLATRGSRSKAAAESELQLRITLMTSYGTESLESAPTEARSMRIAPPHDAEAAFNCPPHEVAILVRGRAADAAAASAQRPQVPAEPTENTPLTASRAERGRGYADTVVRALRGAGLLVDVATVRTKKGSTKYLLLLSALQARLVVQANAIKKREWLAAPGVSTELVLDPPTTTYTPAQRLRLVHDAARAAPLLPSSGAARAVGVDTLLDHPDVELVFALHDRAATARLLASIAGRVIANDGADVETPSVLSAAKSLASATRRRASITGAKLGDGLGQAMSAVRSAGEATVGAASAAVKGEVKVKVNFSPSASALSDAAAQEAAKAARRAEAAAETLRGLGRSSWHELYGTLVLSDAKLSAIREHFGDEVGFYFGFCSHFVWCLLCLVPVALVMFGMSVVLPMGEYRIAQLIFSVVVVTWGAVLLYLWRRRRAQLRCMWGLPETDTEIESRRPEFVPDAGQLDSDYSSPARRALKMLTSLPAFLLLLFAMFTVTGAVFYWEMWIIFTWGGCRQKNQATQIAAAQQNTTWDAALGCATSADNHGFVGWSYEMAPAITEALVFALTLLSFQALSRAVTNWLNWRTEQQWERCYAWLVVLLNFFGMFGWYFYLAFWYAPDYDVGLESDLHARRAIWISCEGRHDTFFCIKEEVNYRLRLQMMADYMLTPFVLNQLINMAALVLLPRVVIASLHKYQGGVQRSDGGRSGTSGSGGARHGVRGACGRCRAWFCSALCVDVLLPLLGGTCENIVAELAHFESDPRSVPLGTEDGTGQQQDDEARKGKKPRPAPDVHSVNAILSESVMGEFKPFDEHLELYLNFLWVVFFSIVFPLGPIFALVNNSLEMRADLYKLTRVCTRPVPRAVNSTGVWDSTFFPLAVDLSAVVNAGLVFVSYAVLSYLSGAFHAKPLSAYWHDALIFALVYERVLKLFRFTIEAALNSTVDSGAAAVHKRHKQYKVQCIATMEKAEKNAELWVVDRE